MTARAALSSDPAVPSRSDAADTSTRSPALRFGETHCSYPRSPAGTASSNASKDDGHPEVTAEPRDCGVRLRRRAGVPHGFAGAFEHDDLGHPELTQAAHATSNEVGGLVQRVLRIELGILPSHRRGKPTADRRRPRRPDGGPAWRPASRRPRRTSPRTRCRWRGPGRAFPARRRPQPRGPTACTRPRGSLRSPLHRSRARHPRAWLGPAVAARPRTAPVTSARATSSPPTSGRVGPQVDHLARDRIVAVVPQGFLRRTPGGPLGDELVVRFAPLETLAAKRFALGAPWPPRQPGRRARPARRRRWRGRWPPRRHPVRRRPAQPPVRARARRRSPHRIRGPARTRRRRRRSHPRCSGVRRHRCRR